jgi:cytochrome c biogenesis protein CcmG/thiol:disulfide interchange protein DsbE
MVFSSSLGKKIDTGATWIGVALCLTLLVLTGAGWASKGFKRPSVGKPAPAFVLSGLDSRDSVALSALKGKVVLIDFWASWCLPCRQLMPRIAELKARYPEVEVVAISVDANREKAITFLRAVEPSLRAVHDPDHAVADSYGVERMPSSFLIDKEGRLRFRHDGYSERDLDAMERRMRLLLDE